MASNNGFDAEKMFQLYLHDYFVKNNMHLTAENFRREVMVDPRHPVAIDVPDGFLHEWWNIFYEFVADQHPKSVTQTSSQVMNMTENQPQVLQPMVPPQSALDQQSHRQFPMSTNFNMMIGESSNPQLAANFQEEELLRRSIILQQQLNNHYQQQVVKVQDDLQSFDLGGTTLMDPALLGEQSSTLPVSGLHGSGLNGGVNQMPSNAWPMDAPNHQNQFQLPTNQHQQQNLAPTQSFALGNLTSIIPGSSADFSSQNLTIPSTDIGGTNEQAPVRGRQTAWCQPQRKQPQNQQPQEKGRRKNKSTLSRAKGNNSSKHS